MNQELLKLTDRVEERLNFLQHKNDKMNLHCPEEKKELKFLKKLLKALKL